MQNIKVKIILYILLTFLSVISIYFVSHDEAFYKTPIVKITDISEKKLNEVSTEQTITGKVLNGADKGKVLHLKNEYSSTFIISNQYKVRDEVFVTIKKDSAQNITYATITNYKRDLDITYLIVLFMLLIIFIGGLKGFTSLISLMINILIFIGIIRLAANGYNFYLLSLIACILFITISLFIVSGINKKGVAAITGSLISIAITLLISIGIFLLYNPESIHFENMELVVDNPRKIFFVEIILGVLGGIMDIAITMTSSIFHLHEENPTLDEDALMKSSTEIGKDVMGTMANTLTFAYLSGSIPILILWMGNHVSLSYMMNYGINLEIIRALTGSIGIVLSIPISISTALYFMKRYLKQEGEIEYDH